jgi:hypothetical protein
MEDVENFHIRLGDEFDVDGAIVFRKGGEEIYRREIGDDWPETPDTREPMPAEVKEVLSEGTEITWGFYAADGGSVTASFRVVDPGLGERVAEIDRRLEGRNPLLARQLKAQLYLNAGLACAAYREASAIAEAAPRAVKAYAVMRAALEALDLHGTALWADLQQKTAGLGNG